MEASRKRKYGGPGVGKRPLKSLRKLRRSPDEGGAGGSSMDSSTLSLVEAEEKEQKRLSRLLGLEQGKKMKSRSQIAAKLNKEYGMYEGMGDDFGDFLMDLDDLADLASGKEQKRKRVFASEGAENNKDDDEEVEEQSAPRAHILDDDEQEQSDISGGEEDEGFDYDDDDEERADDDEEGEDDGDDEVHGAERTEDSSQGDEQGGGDGAASTSSSKDVYRPTPGEDLYGLQQVGASGKYVPPAKRSQLAGIDEASEAVKIVRRQMTGLMNRLSDQTKDQILRSIKAIFESNSASVVTHILRDCIMVACGNSTQIMTSLIPIYASLVAALHLIVGVDVGAFVVESLTNKLFQSIEKSKQDSAKGSSSKVGISALVGDKMPNNCLLLLSHLYNLRIFHHQLIVDIMGTLAKEEYDGSAGIGELQAELLVCIVDHCGVQLRGDDPVGLRSIINSLTSKMMGVKAPSTSSPSDEESSRVSFLLESLTDLKNNKSRRVQSSNAEIVKHQRRWLGVVKSSFSCKSGDLCLRVSLLDLLDAEKHGRWWRAGASWLGKQAQAKEVDDENSLSSSPQGKQVPVASSEEQQLLALAVKMRFNTTVRKNIFVVVMSSRDVNDAFERLGKLDLKGKQDREVMRVIVECCGQEKKYNAFYAELAALLCDRNHQFKMTLQFCFWDALKDMAEGRVKSRRAMNLAHLLAHIVCTFHLPLAVIKPIDVTQLTDSLVLFLATFFLEVFSSKTSDEIFEGVFDRVATTKDYATVREIATTFLQTHFASVPAGLEADKRKLIEKRRLKAVKILESMEVLDFRGGGVHGKKD